MTRTDAVHPPRWAELIIGLVVPRERKGDVLGDLLEEYRDAKIPMLGVRRANRWYVRQAVYSVWQLAAIFCLFTLALHTWREAIDELVYTDSYFLRSYILSYSMIGAYFIAGAWAGWRVGRIPAGILASGCVCLVGWSGSWITAGVLALLQQAKYYPGGVGEIIVLPFMTLPLALTLGAAGAVMGKLMRRAAPLAA
jgi:hypothetical protein